MLSWLMNTVLACWNPVDRCVRSADDVADSQDALLWYKDLDRHAAGQYSMAIVQANQLMEDYSQVESGSSYGTFVGVYDGHGGPEAAKFIKRHLFSHFMQFTLEDGGVSVEVLQKAIRATEEGFERLVTESWSDKPQIAAVGSCCLVGAISGDTLYIANVGDSRAVMGSVLKTTEAVFPLQLTIEHNASIEAVRQELKSLHPDDAHIVVLKHGVWRVKGIIQVSRSIGDFYLKKQEFNREPLFARFRIAEPLKRPILTAEPAIVVHKIKLQEDQFVIFASDGLWEHLSNEEAVEIVHKYPRSGIARRLIRTALQEAAKKREMRYIDLKKIDRGIRRHFHDDITVIVIFFDHELIGKSSVCSAVRSVREVDHSFSPALYSSVNLSTNGHYAVNGCYL